jgi:hypothetical protein
MIERWQFGDLSAAPRAISTRRVVQEHTGRLFRAARGMGLLPERAEDAVRRCSSPSSPADHEGRGASRGSSAF